MTLYLKITKLITSQLKYYIRRLMMKLIHIDLLCVIVRVKFSRQ